MPALAGPTGSLPPTWISTGWTRRSRVNTIAPLRVANAFLPNVKAAKGRIITLSSQMGATGASSDSLAYRVSKQAVNRLMRGLATELKPHGIPVLIVHPGWVKTEMGGDGAQLTPDESAATSSS